MTLRLDFAALADYALVDQQGKLSVALHDATPAAAAVWSKRRELLQRAGFTTELIASATGTTLVVRW